MANMEACQVWIEQRSEELFEDGMTYENIGRLVAKEIAKLFEVEINSRTIARKTRRNHDQDPVTNVTNKSNNESKAEENKENRSLENGLETGRGGTRKGAGRPSTNELIIKLNQKINELYQVEKEYEIEYEKQHAKDLKFAETALPIITYGVILKAIIIIEDRIDIVNKKGISIDIPSNKRVEFINRWNKISLFINDQIRRLNNE